MPIELATPVHGFVGKCVGAGVGAKNEWVELGVGPCNVVDDV